MNCRIAPALLCGAVALLTLGAGTSLAAFPGRPGPIAYSGSTEEEGFGIHVGAPAWGPLPGR